jgi:hypothetical protein
MIGAIMISHLAVTNTIKMDIDIEMCIGVTGLGWDSKSRDGLPAHAFMKEELECEYGMRHFKWDGICVLITFYLLIFTQEAPRTTHLLLNREHRIIGVLAGRPCNAKWGEEVHDKALAALQSAASEMGLRGNTAKGKPEGDHDVGRRRPFPSISYGLSFGGGQTVRAFSCGPTL